ncbi:hypothetical protein PGT21_036567 [Puccinia graminis f. sp. tritici]|uniref:Uncharacterized protein n=1 Tax=Puccinia graminis f. sp. tritici TaxID=56615 RepID=A0A5B0PKT8_PUCGR|nr:hypothetical protein PGT21_036567 [Puccinia graminis f. sp. tritici]
MLRISIRFLDLMSKGISLFERNPMLKKSASYFEVILAPASICVFSRASLSMKCCSSSKLGF